MIRPIHSIVTIAGTIVLVGCDTPQERQSAQSIFQAFGVTDLVSQAPAPAAVAYAEVKPEPLAPAMQEVCWEEPRRAGTWFEKVCEMRVVD